METDGCVLVEASKFLRGKWFGAKLLKITVVCLHLETYRLLLQHFLNFFFPPLSGHYLRIQENPSW